MEQILSLMVEVEEKATNILKLAEDEKQRIYQKSRVDLEQYDKQLNKEVEEKLELLRKKNEIEVEAARANMMQEYEQNLEKLNQDYNKKQDDLVKQIMKQLIGE